jgi:hypothetical protein
VDEIMAKTKIDLYVGIGLLIIVVLNALGLLSMIGITQRFIDIVFALAGIYLIIKGLK